MTALAARPLEPHCLFLAVTMVTLLGSMLAACAGDTARKLSASDHMTMQLLINRQIKPCLSPAFGGGNSAATLRLHLNEDGTLASPPQVIASGSPSAASAAIRAVVRCVTVQHPLKFKRELYPSWKVLDLSVKPDVY
jgi:hypothetical protein